jgi:hypothetical protein
MDKKQIINAGYGIKRLRGLLDFMDQEDWSERLPELKEWVMLLDKHRNLDFKSVFPEMSALLD